MASQSTMTEMDKGQYQQIQTVIEQNKMISGFDLYYLGFLSYYSSQLSLDNIFTHVRNIISLHSDGLITNEEKIEFLLRIVSKKVDFSELQNLTASTEDKDAEAENKRVLGEYFRQILKIIPQYTNISPFELFYLGRFHAICPNHKIAELFQHINNINVLVSEDLIDEETQIDFLLKILNKKIKTNKGGGHFLNIPRDQEIRQRELFNVKNEEGESKQDKAPEKVAQPKGGSPIKSNHEEQGSRHEEQSKEGKSGKDRGDKSDRSSDPNAKKMKKSKGEKEATDDINKENHTNQKYTKETREEFDGKRGGNTKSSKEGNKIIKTTNLHENERTRNESEDDRKQTEVRKGVSLYGAITIKTDPNKLINQINQRNPAKQIELVIKPNELQARDNARTMELEMSPAPFDDDSHSNNDSTSVDSGDKKTTRFTRSAKMISNLVIPAQALVAVGAGGYLTNLTNFGGYNQERSIEINQEYFTENKVERIGKVKKIGSNVEELVTRVRSGNMEGFIEKESPVRRIPPIEDMLPPVDSVLQSQVSATSEKPLLLAWKNKRVLLSMEENKEEEDEEGLEDSVSRNELDSSEDESAPTDKRPVKLGKRSYIINNVKESKKKVKTETSDYQTTAKGYEGLENLQAMDEKRSEINRECKPGKLEISRDMVKEENRSKMSIEKEKKEAEKDNSKMEEETKKPERRPKMKMASPIGTRKPMTPYFANDSNDEGYVSKKNSKKQVRDFSEENLEEDNERRRNVKTGKESKKMTRMKVQKGRNDRESSRSRSRSNDNDN